MIGCCIIQQFLCGVSLEYEFALCFYLKAAKLGAKKAEEKSGGWFGGWFGGKKKKEGKEGRDISKTVYK